MSTTEDELASDVRHWKAVADGLRIELAETQAHLGMRNSDLAQAVSLVESARAQAIEECAEYLDKIGARYHSGKDLVQRLRILKHPSTELPPNG